MRVRVHKNLRKNVWSVVNPKHGRVIAHVERVELRNATCRVQPAGRARTQRTGQRNVHAYVIGEFVTYNTRRRGDEPWARFSYNPHRVGAFTINARTPVHGAERVLFDEQGAWLQKARRT